MSFPVDDWQFWAVTAAALLAAGWIFRGVLPIPFLSRRAKNKKQSRRATLTVKGKPPAAK